MKEAVSNISRFTTAMFAVIVIAGCVNDPDPTYTLTTTVSPPRGGTITLVPPGPSYSAGTEVTLVATPDTGYRFSGWFQLGSENSSNEYTDARSIGSALVTTITVDANVKAAAAFTYTAGGNETFTYSGQTYKTVKIGTQTWMAENLNYAAAGSICSGFDDDYCTSAYGRLYDWETAKGVCPSGWRLPSNAEWTALIDYVSGDGRTTGSDNVDFAVGKYLKSANDWNNMLGNCGPFGSGNSKLCEDSYGFAALPGGYKKGTTKSGTMSEGRWWSASESSADSAYMYAMGNSVDANTTAWGDPTGGGFFLKLTDIKSSLFSVRCVKD